MQSREIEDLANLTRGIPAAENSRRTPLWARTACRPIALWKARGRSPFREGRITGNKCERGLRTSSESSSKPRRVHRAQEPGHIFRGKLEAQGRAKMIDAKVAEVFIEIP